MRRTQLVVAGGQKSEMRQVTHMIERFEEAERSGIGPVSMLSSSRLQISS